MTQSKYIFITGGVVSSLGKGVSAASLGTILEARGMKVSLLKMDPYINVDPGTMSPFQHGEVFVTDDGAETDLDLGHYERFVNQRMSDANSFSAGKVYDSVLKNERQGKYLGATVQVIPHITDEIKRRILKAGEGADITIAEVGGTIGDIESLPFQETIRQLSVQLGRDNVIFIHVTLLPFIKSAGELKTKPTQHSVKELLSIGIQPDFLICRSEHTVSAELKKKIALFTNVVPKKVIQAIDVDSIYRVPQVLAKQKLDAQILEHFKLETQAADLSDWDEVLHKLANPRDELKIAMVGKYVGLNDAYLSVNEALLHAGIHHQIKVDIEHIDAEEIEENGTAVLEHCDAILVPGGFGPRGFEGKVKAVNYARTHRIPYLGICLGMQCAVIEFARNCTDLAKADSTEWSGKDAVHPVIALAEEWVDDTGQVQTRNEQTKKGGSMRLGAQSCQLEKGSIAQTLYAESTIQERHRHRYEVNNQYLDVLMQAGLTISGRSAGGLVEMVELPKAIHPWFVGCQFHPELKSTPRKAHPLFIGFIEASLNT